MFLETFISQGTVHGILEAGGRAGALGRLLRNNKTPAGNATVR